MCLNIAWGKNSEYNILTYMSNKCTFIDIIFYIFQYYEEGMIIFVFLYFAIEETCLSLPGRQEREKGQQWID